MEFRTFYVLIAIIFTPYTTNGNFVPLRQMLNLPSRPATSTNATLLNGLFAFADTLIQELQSTRNEVRAAESEINAIKKDAALQAAESVRTEEMQSAREEIRAARNDINVMKKDATLTSATLANMSIQINRAEAGLEIAKLSVIKCPPKQRSRPLPVGIMKSGDYIGVDEKFCSGNGKTCLFMQGYTNLVLYETLTYRTLWNLNTNLNPLTSSCEASLNVQTDGNLCIYNKVSGGAASVTLWCARGKSELGCDSKPGKDIVAGYNLGGADRNSYKQSDESGCCQMCHRISGCKAYAYLYPGCWLRNVDGPFINSDGVNAGIPYTEEPEAELSFESDGHLCLKHSRGQSCTWTTRK